MRANKLWIGGRWAIWVFVTADEQLPSIIAGLKALQQRMPDWKLEFVMADFSEAQITAVETVYHGQ